MAKNSIGQFIAALRKANGLTQQEVADRLNVSNKAVSRWERDECAPDISVIPALAEMFGVTCDELLKGERIAETCSAERKETRVEKQVKNLVNRTLFGFKTLIGISLAVAVVGLVCMFGISYGFYRPVIGFAVMLLFEVCALAMAILAVSRTRDMKNDNELFEMADGHLVEKFNDVLGLLSFVAFFVIFAVILLSLPLAVITSHYVYSVVAPYSYFTVFFGGIVLFLAVIYLKCKKPYMAWIAGKQLPKSPGMPIAKSKAAMTRLQVGLIVIAGLIFVLAPYLDINPHESTFLYEAVVCTGLACLLASLVCFVVFLVKQEENRRGLVLTGIRNILFIPSALIISEIHHTGWYSSGGEEEYAVSQMKRYDDWEMRFLWYALALAILVILVFALIDAKNQKKH